MANLKNKKTAAYGKYLLGLCYLTGTTCKDEAKALKCFQVATKRNQEAVEELYKLGTQYLNGDEDIPKNEKLAVKILKIIATTAKYRNYCDFANYSVGMFTCCAV